MFQICLKGKVHIFKYLNMQACRMDKKPDTLDLPSLGKRCLPQLLTDRYSKIDSFMFQHRDMKHNASVHHFWSSKSTMHRCYLINIVFPNSSMEDFYPSKNHGPDSGIGSDNGDKRLSTTEVSTQLSLTRERSAQLLWHHPLIEWLKENKNIDDPKYMLAHQTKQQLMWQHGGKKWWTL